MSYANPLMLIGLAGVLIPIIIHLITQHRARRVDWGAMVFLTESVVHRSRRMLLEQILLLVARCLLVGLVAMALALPFVRPDSQIPWPLVLPVVLLGVAALGAATAMTQYPRWRWGLIGAGVLLLGLAGVATAAQRWLGGEMLKPSGSVDLAIVIDGSDSMHLKMEGVTNYQAALAEANEIITALRPGDAASIVLAGAVVEARPAAPTRRAEELRKALAEWNPGGGMMSARQALSAAAEVCARGENANKKIVVITDGQSAGWRVGERVDWEQISAALKKLPTQPEVVLRKLPLPERINNLQIAELRVAEGVLGPDRDQTVDVRVENTGTEPLTEAVDVEWTVDDSPTTLRQSIPRLDPGAGQSLTFRFRPQRGGLHVVQANLARADDFAWDNSLTKVVRTFEQVPILLVDGNPAARPRDRASWYLDLALSPEPGDAAGDSSTEPAGLYRVTNVDYAKVGTIGDLSRFRVIVLADVPKLPTLTAVSMADFVANGGGLLVSLGSRCQPSFYNHWQGRGGPLMPGTLTRRHVADTSQPATHPQVGSFAHPALRLVGEDPQTDIGGATITSYWQVQVPSQDDATEVCAALATGDPWLVQRQSGRGRVIVSSVSLDRSGSDLPSLQSFLPLVHELVGNLAQLPTGGPQLAMGDRHTLELVPVAGVGSGGRAVLEATPSGQQGLKGEYFAGSAFAWPVLQRIDATIAWNWPQAPIAGLSDPEFSVRWTGTLTPEKSDVYTFAVEGEQTRVWINGKRAAATVPVAQEGTSGTPAPSPPIHFELSGNKPYCIRVEHRGKSGQGKCELYWQGKQVPRQIIPATCLSPSAAWQVELAGNAQQQPPIPSGELVGPNSSSTPVVLAPSGAGVVASLQANLKPGLFRLRVPETMREPFQELLVQDAVPIAIAPPVEESRLTVLGKDDLAAAAPHVKLSAASSAADVIALISGKATGGQRLWRHLAIAALILAVAEIALARWIASQRLVGHEPVVEFTMDAGRGAGLASAAFQRFETGIAGAKVKVPL